MNNRFLTNLPVRLRRKSSNGLFLNSWLLGTTQILMLIALLPASFTESSITLLNVHKAMMVPRMADFLCLVSSRSGGESRTATISSN